MSATPTSSVAVLCDFDGTITKGEVLDMLYRQFAGAECWQLVQRWLRGEISTPDEVRGCFASIKATRLEMEAALDTVQVDPSFREFVDFCLGRRYRFAVLSDGFQWYIQYILGRYGISGLTIYANQIEFLPDGMRISFPWQSPETPLRGTSKPAIIRRYQREGCRVVFIGDGPSDIEAAEVAEKVYAKGRLLDYCQKQGIPAIGFTRFADLVNLWQAPN
jgi:2,3-diketo-5-methylthio-1-phosphopentane phosphatase